MITSLQRFRVKLYVYSDTGTGGVMTSTYTYKATRFCSVYDTGGSQVIEGGRLEHQTVRKFIFDDRAEVAINGLIIMTQPNDGQYYKVVSINRRPMHRQIIVTAVAVNQEQLNVVG